MVGVQNIPDAVCFCFGIWACKRGPIADARFVGAPGAACFCGLREAQQAELYYAGDISLRVTIIIIIVYFFLLFLTPTGSLGLNQLPATYRRTKLRNGGNRQRSWRTGTRLIALHLSHLHLVLHSSMSHSRLLRIHGGRWRASKGGVQAVAGRCEVSSL